MRIAALYDIHGNAPALEAVIQDIERESIDLIVFGGDVVPGPLPNEAFALIDQVRVPTRFIIGNGEVAVSQAARGEALNGIPEGAVPGIQWTAAQLNRMQLKYLSGWPKAISLEHTHLGTITFCHATPGNENTILTERSPDEKWLQALQGTRPGIVVCGHTHLVLDRTVGPYRIVNPGSVGMPFGDPGAYWAVLDQEVDWRCTHYPAAEAVARISASGYPDAAQLAERFVLSPPSADEMLAAFESR